MASSSNDEVAFQVMTMGNSEGPVVSAAAGTTVRELRELVAAAMEAEAVALKLVVGDLLLEDNERPVQEACAEAWAAAVAEQRPVDLMVVKQALSPAERAELVKKLLTAAQCGNVTDIKALLQAGADSEATDRQGWTVLLNASYYGHVEAVKALVEVVAAILEALLFVQVHHNVYNMLTYPQAGAEVNAQDCFGHTALYYAEDHTEAKRDPANFKPIAAYLRSKGATK